MDDWLLHRDLLNRFLGFQTNDSCLVTVLRQVESVIERDFCILVALRKARLESALEDAEFHGELQAREFKLTAETPRGPNLARRFYARIMALFPTAQHSWRGMYLPEDQQEISTRTNEFREGRKIVELTLRKEVLREDLRKIRRCGVFCFESFRFSERTVEQLAETEREEVIRGDTFIYKRVFRNQNSLRPRMASFSVLTGKILVSS